MQDLKGERSLSDPARLAGALISQASYPAS
jgi:hypothetical protein